MGDAAVAAAAEAVVVGGAVVAEVSHVHPAAAVVADTRGHRAVVEVGAVTQDPPAGAGATHGHREEVPRDHQVVVVHRGLRVAVARHDLPEEAGAEGHRGLRAASVAARIDLRNCLQAVAVFQGTRHSVHRVAIAPASETDRMVAIEGTPRNCHREIAPVELAEPTARVGRIVREWVSRAVPALSQVVRAPVPALRIGRGLDPALREPAQAVVTSGISSESPGEQLPVAQLAQGWRTALHNCRREAIVRV